MDTKRSREQSAQHGRHEGKERSHQHGQHEGERNILINMDNMREKETF
jgi:hypothetical protein